VARFSENDARRLPDYYARLESVAEVMRSMLLETPPNIGGGMRDLFPGLKAARRLHSLSLPAQREVLDLFTMSAGDWLGRWFMSDPIKSAFGLDSAARNFPGPFT